MSAYYIVTDSNIAPSPFAPPHGTTDYTRWLVESYHRGMQPSHNHCVAVSALSQQVNNILHHVALHESLVIAVGPHANQVSEALSEIAGMEIPVRVLAA